MSEFFDPAELEELEPTSFILVPLPENEEYGDDVRAFIDPADPIDDFIEATTTNHPRISANYLLGLLGETDRNIVKLANGYFADRTFGPQEISDMYGVPRQSIYRIRKEAYNQMHSGFRVWSEPVRWPELGYIPMPPESKKIK